jgi:hypothetical protein
MTSLPISARRLIGRFGAISATCLIAIVATCPAGFGEDVASPLESVARTPDGDLPVDQPGESDQPIEIGDCPPPYGPWIDPVDEPVEIGDCPPPGEGDIPVIVG